MDSTPCGPHCRYAQSHRLMRPGSPKLYPLSPLLPLPAVLVAAAPAMQSDPRLPLQPAPARKGQREIAKGRHCGLLSLKAVLVRAGLSSGMVSWWWSE
jgi:hypothetical protein